MADEPTPDELEQLEEEAALPGLPPQRRRQLERQKNYVEKRRELGRALNDFQKVVGALNKLRMVLPLAQAAIAFVFAALSSLGVIGAVVIILIAVAATAAIAGVLIWFNTSEVKLRSGSDVHSTWNAENSTDRENLRRVQTAAGLIPALQADLANARQIDAQLATALELLKKAPDSLISPEDKEKFREKLLELQRKSKDIQKLKNQEGHDRRVEEFNRLKLELEAMVGRLAVGFVARLPVPWRFQPPKSKTCNFYAALMALLYHANEQGKYTRLLEQQIIPGAALCATTTRGYMKVAAQKAGFTNFEVVEVPFRGANRGPSEADWEDIKKVVSGQKTGKPSPVVIGTKFSKGQSHFVTVVGFGTEAGKEVVYITDPGARKAPYVKDPRAKNAPLHYRDDERWSGGKYPKYLYYKFQ